MRSTIHAYYRGTRLGGCRRWFAEYGVDGGCVDGGVGRPMSRVIPTAAGVAVAIPRLEPPGRSLRRNQIELARLSQYMEGI